jgi:hypothetical protein
VWFGFVRFDLVILIANRIRRLLLRRPPTRPRAGREHRARDGGLRKGSRRPRSLGPSIPAAPLTNPNRTQRASELVGARSVVFADTGPISTLFWRSHGVRPRPGWATKLGLSVSRTAASLQGRTPGAGPGSVVHHGEQPTRGAVRTDDPCAQRGFRGLLWPSDPGTAVGPTELRARSLDRAASPSIFARQMPHPAKVS